MIETPVRTSGASETENLRAELARGDALAGTVLPFLRHLLSNERGALFGDEILARVRAMLAHLARELLAAIGQEGGAPDFDQAQLGRLSDALLAAPALLGHLHAEALEWALTERLEARCGVDPAIPPLVQDWIASAAGPRHFLATRLLAAQAKWCQAQRRMAISLHELPGEALHAALLALRSALPAAAQLDEADAAIRASYDEAATRLGLAARLVTELGEGAGVALELEEAGASLFLTTLALHSGETRDAVALATHETQTTRLALTLIAAGLAPQAAERQIDALHAQARFAPGLERMDAEQAFSLLHSAPDGGV